MNSKHVVRCAAFVGALVGCVIPAARVCAQAYQRCEWIGNPAANTIWSPWSITSTGLLWNTESRTCVTTFTGPATWSVWTKSRSMGFSVGVSSSGGVTAGAQWSCSEVIVPGTTTTANGTAQAVTGETRCLWTSGSVPSAMTTIPMVAGSSTNISNGWVNSTVTFDGQSVAYGDSVNLRGRVGPHAYVVSRTDGVNTQTLNFMLSVTPDYTLEYLGYGNTPNGSARYRFHNLSPDPIDAVFTASASWAGTMTHIDDSWRHVVAGGTTDLLVDFFTNPGFVVLSGEQITGTLFAHFGTETGEVLTSAPVSVPAPGCVGVVGLVGLGVWRRRRG